MKADKTSRTAQYMAFFRALETRHFKKTSVFKKQSGGLPQNITYCQIDFNKESMDELAEREKFNLAKPATIIWEGVTNYLSAEAIDKTFSFIAKFPPGSFIIFTYVDKEVLENPRAFFGGEKLLQDLSRIEERWTFGFRPAELAAYLSRFGLALLEDAGAEEYRQKYLPERREKGYEFYRVAMAAIRYFRSSTSIQTGA